MNPALTRLLHSSRRKANEASTARDEHLAAARRLISDAAASGETSAEFLGEVAAAQLHRLSQAAATVATTLEGSAKVAEEANRNVKEVDGTLQRVQKCLDVVKAVQAQRESVRGIGAAISQGRYDDAAAAIKSFDDSQKRLTKYKAAKQELTTVMQLAGTKPATPGAENNGGVGDSHLRETSDGSPNRTGDAENLENGADSDAAAALGVNEEEVIGAARSQLRDSVRMELDAACTAKDEKKVMHYARTLAQLSFRDEARAAYVDWRCQVACEELKSFVDDKLTKATNTDDHLQLVSQVLDHIVSDIEASEPYMVEAFGSVGALVDRLHSDATAQCVRVLDDFLSRRSTSSGASSSSASRSRDPKMLDQLLQDISHQLSCCAIYIDFVKGKCEDPKVLRTGVLSAKLAELLTLYVPWQAEYFQCAFAMGLHRVDEFLVNRVKAARLAQEKLAANTSSPTASGSSLMGAISSLVSSASTTEKPSAGTSSPIPAGGSSSSALSGRSPLTTLSDADVQLAHTAADVPLVEFVEDLFYVCRVACHRMMATKNIAVASSTFNTVVELLREKLVAEFHARLKGLCPPIPDDLVHHQQVVRKSGGGGAPAGTGASAARQAAVVDATQGGQVTNGAWLWLSAVCVARDYCERLGKEVHQLAASTFTAGDALRLQEQAADLRAVADVYADFVAKTSAKAAGVLFHGFPGFSEFLQSDAYCASLSHGGGGGGGGSGMPNSRAGSSDGTMSDPSDAAAAESWATNATAEWRKLLQPLGAVLHEHARELIVANLASKVAKTFEECIVRKQAFDIHGALQLDKDVRLVRGLFEEVTERPIRDKFARLTSTVSVLLCDRAEDASALPTTVLTRAEIKKFIGFRRDLAPPAL